MLRIYLVLGNIVRGGTAIHPARRRRLQTYTDFRVRERQMDDGWLSCPAPVMVLGFALSLGFAVSLTFSMGLLVGAAWLLGGRLVATVFVAWMAGYTACATVTTPQGPTACSTSTQAPGLRPSAPQHQPPTPTRGRA